MIKHIVMWKMKDFSNKDENLSKMKTILEALRKNIDTIKTLEVGINFNQRDIAADIVLFSEFSSKEDLIYYEKHHSHQKAVQFFREVSKAVAVVDYES